MKKIIVTLFFFFAALKGYSQLTVGDSVTCTSITLNASFIGMIPVSSGITGDDNWSAVIPIGFSYNFYGAAHTQCIIGSNGELGFQIANALAYNTWPINNTLATGVGSAPDVVNCICGPWCDIYIPAGGTIMYATVDSFPNRKFEVTWCGTAMYSCTTEWTTTQIIIYEATGIAEVHIGHHTSCAWNGGHAIVGVINAAGGGVTVAPGRDFPATWATTNEAWRFTPVGTTSYTVSSIPYSPIPYASSAIYWYDSTTGAYLGSGTSITVHPTVPTTYMACAIGCNDTTKAYIHELPVGTSGGSVPHITAFAPTNPSACGLCDGKIVLHGLIPGLIDTVFYTFGASNFSFVTSALVDSTITISGLCGGSYTNIFVKVGNCPSNIGAAILVTPVLSISNETFTNPTLCGECNGSIKLYGLTPMQPVSVAYSFNGLAQPPYTGYVNIDSTFVMTNRCAGIYTGITATIGACNASAPNDTLTQPGITATWTSPTVCGKNDGSIVLSFLPPDSTATITFAGGPGSPASITVGADSLLTISGLIAGSYTTINAALNISNCLVTITPINLINPPINAAFDTAIRLGCNGDSIILNNWSTPTGYQYYWRYGDGSSLDSTHPNPIHVYNDVASNHTGTYHVTLIYSTYYSCYDSVSYDVSYNHPLVAAYAPDPDTVCFGSPITFVNSSSSYVGSNVIYSWTFGDMVTSTDVSPIHTYAAGGIYQTNMTMTDYLGCQASASHNINVIHITATLEHYDTTVCLADSLKLVGYAHFDSTTIAGVSYLWTPTDFLGNNTMDYVYYFGTGKTDYTFKITSVPFGCVATATEVVNSLPPLHLTNVTESQMIPYGSTIQLNADNAWSYYWTPNDGTLTDPNINNPKATPLDSTTYTVYGMNIYGCKDSAFIKISIDYDMNSGIPSAFSPNGDGLNDKFHVVNLKYKKLVDLKVFNRWGELMYESTNPNDGWDGPYKGVPQDIGDYNYSIILAKPDNTQTVYTGTVTLIR